MKKNAGGMSMYKVLKYGKVIHEEATYEQASSWLWMYKRALKAFNVYFGECQFSIERASEYA